MASSGSGNCQAYINEEYALNLYHDISEKLQRHLFKYYISVDVLQNYSAQVIYLVVLYQLY